MRGGIHHKALDSLIPKPNTRQEAWSLSNSSFQLQAPELGRRVQKEYCLCQQNTSTLWFLRKSSFPLLLGFMLGHHSSAEQLADGPVIILEDFLQDVCCVLPKQGRRPGL